MKAVLADLDQWTTLTIHQGQDWMDRMDGSYPLGRGEWSRAKSWHCKNWLNLSKLRVNQCSSLSVCRQPLPLGPDPLGKKPPPATTSRCQVATVPIVISIRMPPTAAPGPRSTKPPRQRRAAVPCPLMTCDS